MAMDEVYLPSASWIIDREKNIVLIDCGVLSRDDYRQVVFALLYKKLDNDHLISFTLMRTGFTDEEADVLKKNYNVSSVRKWKILKCGFPEKLERIANRTVVYDILADAMSVYGLDGNPNVSLDTKAIIEGKNGEYYYGNSLDNRIRG